MVVSNLIRYDQVVFFTEKRRSNDTELYQGAQGHVYAERKWPKTWKTSNEEQMKKIKEKTTNF